jgi:hypothetical protein
LLRIVAESVCPLIKKPIHSNDESTQPVIRFGRANFGLMDRFAGATKSRGAFMEPLCALNPLDLELLQRASHLSDEPGGTKN